jgi:hypothetical protein
MYSLKDEAFVFPGEVENAFRAKNVRTAIAQEVGNPGVETIGVDRIFLNLTRFNLPT